MLETFGLDSLLKRINAAGTRQLVSPQFSHYPLIVSFHFLVPKSSGSHQLQAIDCFSKVLP